EDARTGEVLAASHAHEHLAIASLTKMMTVLLALQRHQLSDVVTVDPRAAVVGESTIDVRAGERLTIRDLIKGALIQSANDAAAALALSMAPDFASFARLMNAKAAALGLRDTHFVRPDGLDVPDHYSSAADMTKLARVLMHTRFVRHTVDEQTARLGRPLPERVVAATAVSLPVRQGDVLGRVEVWERGKLRARSDLVASRTVNKPGVVSRLGWYAGRTLHHLGGLF